MTPQANKSRKRPSAKGAKSAKTKNVKGEKSLKNNPAKTPQPQAIKPPTPQKATRILLINGGKKFGESGGKLSATLQKTAKETLQNLGLKVRQTHIDKGYKVKNEVQKWLWADVVIWQMPGWWMGEPWIVKKYIDKVLSAGGRKFFTSDGRHRDNPSANYGTGGLLKDKKYMFSLSWNAPIEAFNNKKEFFRGVGVDMVYLHLHKAHEFVGLSALPTFICNDVMKNPQVKRYIADYKAHLTKIFS